jgi:hypothetical protein
MSRGVQHLAGKAVPDGTPEFVVEQEIYQRRSVRNHLIHGASAARRVLRPARRARGRG